MNEPRTVEGMKAETRRMTKILDDVRAERVRAESLYPGETVASDAMNTGEKMNQLVEELGECARALRSVRFPQQGRKMNLRQELVQLASTAVAWLEAIDRNGTNDGMVE